MNMYHEFKKPRALDLCAGAGGLSLGFQRAGCDVFGVEIDPDAASTHAEHVGPCEVASIWDYVPQGLHELVVGGIPCQSHSTASGSRGGRRGTDEARGQLYRPFLRIARQVEARAIVIENVRGMLTSPSSSRVHPSAIDEIVDAIASAGYETTYAVLNAADYGTAQKRLRLFIVGFAERAAAAAFRWPRATHDEHRRSGLKAWRTVREALGLVGPYRSGRPEGVSWWQGGRWLDVDRPANTITGKGNNDLICPVETEEKLRVARLLDRPATTVDGTGRLSAPGHHKSTKDGAIRLSVRALSLLQGFPPGFSFRGKITSQNQQVGNAVPPQLGEAVARAVLAALGERAAPLSTAPLGASSDGGLFAETSGR